MLENTIIIVVAKENNWCAIDNSDVFFIHYDVIYGITYLQCRLEDSSRENPFPSMDYGMAWSDL